MIDPLDGDDGLPRIVLVGTPHPDDPTKYYATVYCVNCDDPAMTLEMLAGVLPQAVAAALMPVPDARRLAVLRTAEAMADGGGAPDDESLP